MSLLDLFRRKSVEDIDMSPYREMLDMKPKRRNYIYKMLKDSVNKDMSLEELISQFQEMSKIPVITESDLLLFETYSSEDYEIILTRQIDGKNEDEGYIQLQLIIKYDISDITNSIEYCCEWDDGLEENFFDFIKKSEPYMKLKNIKIKDIEVFMDCTD